MKTYKVSISNKKGYGICPMIMAEVKREANSAEEAIAIVNAEMNENTSKKVYASKATELNTYILTI